jgi:hypothetical protein
VHRVSEHNLLCMSLQDPGDRELVAGRLEYHSIARRETLGKKLQPLGVALDLVG